MRGAEQSAILGNLGLCEWSRLVRQLPNFNLQIFHFVHIKGSKAGKPKQSPKPKQGKQKTVWDPFTFGGSGAKGEEAANLNYFNKNVEKNGMSGNQVDSNDPTDHQLDQFVPDRSVIGKSSKLEGTANPI